MEALLFLIKCITQHVMAGDKFPCKDLYFMPLRTFHNDNAMAILYMSGIICVVINLHTSPMNGGATPCSLQSSSMFFACYRELCCLITQKLSLLHEELVARARQLLFRLGELLFQLVKALKLNPHHFPPPPTA